MSVQIVVLGIMKQKACHPYEIKQILLQNKWDKLITVTDGNLYQAIRTLTKNDYIKEIKQEQKNNRPNRTVYLITNKGEEYLRDSILNVFKNRQADQRSLYTALLFIKDADISEVLTTIDEWIHNLESKLKSYIPPKNEIHKLIQNHHYSNLHLQRDWLRDVYTVLSTKI